MAPDISLDPCELCKFFGRVLLITQGGWVCLDPRRHRSARTCSLAARLARFAPGQDTRSGQGSLARRHTDGQLRTALLKTTVTCEAWRRLHDAPSVPSCSKGCDYSS